MAERNQAGGPLRQTLDVLRLFVTERGLRRNAMFLLCLASLALVGMGSIPLQGWLEERPGWFLLYWVFTFLTVLLLMILALYDILRIWRGGER